MPARHTYLEKYPQRITDAHQRKCRIFLHLKEYEAVTKRGSARCRPAASNLSRSLHDLSHFWPILKSWKRDPGDCRNTVTTLIFKTEG